MIALLALGSVAGATLIAVLGAWLFVNHSNKKYQHRMIDVEYERLCQDPRYRVQ